MFECELLNTCGFFLKYQETRDLACRGFMNLYCRGPQKAECKRLAFRGQHGHPPDDDMLPTGQMIAKNLPG